MNVLACLWAETFHNSLLIQIATSFTKILVIFQNVFRSTRCLQPYYLFRTHTSLLFQKSTASLTSSSVTIQIALIFNVSFRLMKQLFANNNSLMPKIYEIWPGRNRFFCGCCIAGPYTECMGQGCIWCCALSILVPFCVFVAQQNYKAAPALLIIFFVAVLSMFFFLYLTACTDPGIIPRKAFLERSPQNFQRFLIPPSKGQARICQSCHIIRPWKASHCSACQNCVQVLDHHCGVIGTCIAKRNYRYFIMFLGSVVTSIALCIINMVVFIISKTSNSINQTVVIVIVAIVSALLGIPLIGFFVFHIYLACTKKTTRELLKNIEKNPDQLVTNQWCDVDPSNINFFQDISEEEAQRIKQQLQIASKPLVSNKPQLPPINQSASEQRQHGSSQNPIIT